MKALDGSVEELVLNSNFLTCTDFEPEQRQSMTDAACVNAIMRLLRSAKYSNL